MKWHKNMIHTVFVKKIALSGFLIQNFSIQIKGDKNQFNLCIIKNQDKKTCHHLTLKPIL